MSYCRLIVPKVGNNKGVKTKSVLYSNILDTVKDPKKATKLYQVAFTSDFINNFGDWINNPQDKNIISKLDSNGEPKLSELKDYITSANFRIKSNRNIEYFKKRYGIDKVMSLGEAQLLSEKINKLYPNVQASWDARTDNKGVVNLHFNTSEYLADKNSDGEVNRLLVSKLLDKFPKLNVKYINQTDIESIIGSRNLLKAGNADNIRSFFHGGTVYIIDGRTDNEMVIEEFLHPFVANIAKDNPEAMLGLFNDAKKNYPQLWNYIQREYNSERGYSNADRAKELVTQSIAKVANNEFEENGLDEISKNDFLSKIETFWNKLRDLIRSLINNSDNRIFADDIVPGTKIDDIAKLLGVKDISFNTYISDPLEIYFNLTEEEQKGENPPLPTDTEADLVEKMLNGLYNYQKILVDRKNFFKESNTNRRSKFQFQGKTINGLEALIAELGTDIDNLKLEYSKGELIRIFSKMLDNIQHDAESISKYINNKKNVSTDPYISVVLEAQKMIDSYSNLRLAVDIGMTNTNIESKMNKTIDQLNTLKDDLLDAVNDYVVHVVKNTTNNDSLTEEEIKKILKESYDIPDADYLFGDMSTSKDTLLAIADIQYKNAMIAVKDRVDERKEQLNTLGKNLINATGGKTKKGLFNFMIDFDDKGNPTGRLVQKIGKQYYNKKKAVMDPLFNEKGEKIEYFEIKNVLTADPAQVRHNQELYAKKKVARMFRSAEIIEDGQIYDGTYHAYTEEFLRDRAKYEIFDGAMWRVSPEYENTPEYSQYRNKYYTDPIEVLVGSPNGSAQLMKMSFPKNEYVYIKDIASTGEDMRDSKWVKLHNPLTNLERAQLEFYNGYLEIYNDLLNRLPEKYRKEMEGKMIKVKMGLYNNIMEHKESMFKIIARSFRQWTKAPEYSAQRVTDETGMISDEVPLFYGGDFQSQKRIDSLQNEIDKLKADYSANKIKQEEYLEQRKQLTSRLNFEMGKVRADEASLDLLDGLSKFVNMAENYDVMSELEDMFKTISVTLQNRRIKRKDFKGNDLYTTNEKGERSPVYKSGKESNSYKRFSAWMKMVFYDNQDIDNSTAATVARKAQTLTSISKIGLNIFSGINNYVMGRINSTIEGVGGQHYGFKELSRATKEFNKQLLPGVLEKLGQLGKSKDPYKDAKPYSKFEALVESYKIVRDQASGQGNPHTAITDWLYLQQKGGEYVVQSKPGIAILMRQKLTNSITGEQVSVYDAYDFNKQTGKLTLKEGFDLSPAEKSKLINKIWEVNKLIHGNWEDVDRMVIQQHWLGQLGAQFHKWLYPAYKARFKKRYFDENLGSMEGRYLTIISFMKHANKLSWNIKNTYAALDENQKANMRKNAAEIGFIMASFAMWAVFKALAANIPPEDEFLTKFVNFLQYQESRQVNELITLVPIAGINEQWQLVSSPIAAANTIKDFGQAIWQTIKIPYDFMSDSMYYERGPFEGDLKYMKEWRDVIPGLYALNRWDSYETIKTFYIK